MHSENRVSKSSMDTESGEITLRVSDGLVNNFCKTIIQAVRCNMDIKFIGLGKSAKAIMYYITNYITKTQLKLHVSYSALKAAVEKTRLQAETYTSDLVTIQARKLLLRCSNSLLGCQELSGQQVASYLMGYPDKFTAHAFKNLYWTSFERYVDKIDPLVSTTQASESPDQASNIDGIERRNNNTSLIEASLNDKQLTIDQHDGIVQAHGTQLLDYIARDDSEVFGNMCVYDFIASIELERIPRTRKSELSKEDSLEEGTPKLNKLSAIAQEPRKRGRP